MLASLLAVLLLAQSITPANTLLQGSLEVPATGHAYVSNEELWLCPFDSAFCNIDFDLYGGTNRLTVHGHLRVLSDVDTYGGFLNLNPNNAPAAPTLSYTPGGSLPQTTYYVRVTPVSLVGEGYTGNATAEQSILVPANNLLVVNTASNIRTGGYSPEFENIYVTTTSGNYANAQQAANITPGNVWTEPASGLVAGASLPSVDNSAGYILSTHFGQNLPLCSAAIPSYPSGYGGAFFITNTCAQTNAQYASVSGTSHNPCSASSGWPCEVDSTLTCSLSAGTQCTTSAATVPSGSVCVATANASDTTTGIESYKVNASFEVAVTVASSQTSTAAFNMECL